MSDEPLDDIASIRKRPGMYVGDCHSRMGPHYMLWEVLANAIDEHLAGRCARIEVVLHADGSASVSDDGAGISVDADESGVPWLEKVLTTLHHTATADGHAPHVHLRRGHHVGLCMVSALSSSLTAEVRVAGRVWRMGLAHGRVVQGLAAIGTTTTTGTTVRFKLDESVFAMPSFEVESVVRRIREISSLLPGLATSFACERQEYGAELSVTDLLEAPELGPRVHERAIVGEASERETVARVAFDWRQWLSKPRITGYCNLDVTPFGTHIEGFRRGLAKALGRRDHRRVFEALSLGLNAVVTVQVIDPRYQGPTRERIAAKEAREVVREATVRALETALESDPALAQWIAARMKRIERS